MGCRHRKANYLQTTGCHNYLANHQDKLLDKHHTRHKGYIRLAGNWSRNRGMAFPFEEAALDQVSQLRAFDFASFFDPLRRVSSRAPETDASAMQTDSEMARE